MLNETEQKVLIRAAELISNKEAWIQGDLFGIKQDPTSPAYGGVDTEKYCALGAIRRATVEVCQVEEPDWYGALPEHEGVVERAVRVAVAGHKPARGIEDWEEIEDTIPEFNDHEDTTHAEVKQMFCDAVKAELEVKDGD